MFFAGLLKCVGRGFRGFVVLVVQSHCFMKGIVYTYCLPGEENREWYCGSKQAA